MSDKAFNSVWDAIEVDASIAANMKHRSLLMMAISEHIKNKGLSQAKAAKMFEVTQPRISDLMRGKIELFSIDTLVAMLAAAGIEVDMRVKMTRAPRQDAPASAVRAKVHHYAVRTGAKPARRRAA
jgi:predicted XRE-type DNA-binding protein